MELEQTRLAKESHGFFTALTIDVQHNLLNVWAAEGGASSHLEALTPRVSTNLLFDQATPAPASGVSGGVAMWWTVSPARRCTSGFSLWNPGTSQTAVLTAGHCQWFYGWIPPSMPGDPNWVALATGTDAAYYSNLDRELHIVPAPHTALPRIATYWGWVPPTGSVSNSSVVIGDFLCKTGFWTSTSCWNVTSTAYTIPGGTNEYPYNMFELITGSIGRNVPNTDGACHGGDSGGPVWDGYVRAVGIIHGRLLPFGGDGSQTGCIVAKIANQLPAGWFIRTS